MLSFLIPITADEAYYYLWSRRLALSYFDHPPMVAYMLFFSRFMFGDGVLGIRFFPLIFSVLIPFYYLHVFQRENDSVFYAMLWFQPILQIVLFFMTPDVPFLFFSTLFILHYLKKRSPDLLGGILLGLVFLSKYMAILLYPAIALCSFKNNRKDFLLYYVFLPFFLFTPVIFFNLTHNFVSFKYQLSHGGGGFVLRPGYFLKYITDIILAGGIPISIAGFLRFKSVLWKEKRFIFYLGFTFFAFFAFFSFFSRQEANWPLLFYPVLLYAGYMTVKNKKYTKWALLTFFVLSVPLKPILLLPPVKAKVFHKEILMKDIAYNIKGTKLPIFANTYQHASLLSYHLKRFVPSLNIKSRLNQFDLWKRNIPDGRFIFVAIGYPDVMSRFMVDSTLCVKDNISVYIVRYK